MTSRNPIVHLLDPKFIGRHVNIYAENLSFTFDIGDDPQTDYIWVAQNGQIYVYLPSPFSCNQYRWGKLYQRNAHEIVPAYDCQFDEESPYYNQQAVDNQRTAYGLEAQECPITDIMYNRGRNVLNALAGRPI